MLKSAALLFEVVSEEARRLHVDTSLGQLIQVEGWNNLGNDGKTIKNDGKNPGRWWEKPWEMTEKP